MKEKNIIPLYQQIRVQILNEIRSGNLKVGDAIDTETVLMKKYNASRTTVRNAIMDLVKTGIVKRTAGKGSFIKKNLPKAEVKLTGTFEDILNVAKTTSAKVLRFEFVEPPGYITELLKLKKNARVLKIDRVRSVGRTPFLYSTNYLPENIGKLLTIKDVEDSILTELFVKKCKQILKKQTQEFGATVADDKMAKLLKIPVGFPLLQIKRVTFSSEDVPINIFTSNFRSDIYLFTATFSYETHKVSQ